MERVQKQAKFPHVTFASFFHEAGVVGFRKFFWQLLMVSLLSTFFFFIKIKIEKTLMPTPPPYQRFFFLQNWGRGFGGQIWALGPKLGLRGDLKKSQSPTRWAWGPSHKQDFFNSNDKEKKRKNIVKEEKTIFTSLCFV